jgi:hypothetical protein
VQILQQNVLLKFKYFSKFIQQHGPEVSQDVRTAYVETLSRIYRSALCAAPPPVPPRLLILKRLLAQPSTPLR